MLTYSELYCYNKCAQSTIGYTPVSIGHTPVPTTIGHTTVPKGHTTVPTTIGHTPVPTRV